MLTADTAINQYILDNGQIRVGIIDLGATILFIETPDRDGRIKNIVAGLADPDQYRQDPYYLGCVVGRYANRIGKGRYFWEGEWVQLSVNNEGNHLHGGFEGLNRKRWSMHAQPGPAGEECVVLEYRSPDGEEGYPGELRIRVSYLLDKRNRLTIGYTATTDKPTPVNLTNHSYFNLSGFDDPVIDDHLLKISATDYTEKNGSNLPTGRLLPLSGTPMDFSTFRRIGECIDQLPLDKGFDHNYVLGNAGSAIGTAASPSLTPAAELYEPVSGRHLRVWTDRPGIQVYTANWWDGSVIGRQGTPYGQHSAVALETQAFPDSPNQPFFPDTILRPGAVYQTTTIFEFDTK